MTRALDEAEVTRRRAVHEKKPAVEVKWHPRRLKPRDPDTPGDFVIRADVHEFEAVDLIFMVWEEWPTLPHYEVIIKDSLEKCMLAHLFGYVESFEEGATVAIEAALSGLRMLARLGYPRCELNPIEPDGSDTWEDYVARTEALRFESKDLEDAVVLPRYEAEQRRRLEAIARDFERAGETDA